MNSFQNSGGGSQGGPPRSPRPFIRNDRPRRPQQTPDAHRINQRITAPQVRVIAENGDQVGVISTREAIQMAENQGLDLVEVSPQANPPVCRLMDYGKFKYKEQKKEQEAKKKRSETELKEIRIRYRTDVGDLETKLKQAREFLEEGNKVKFSMRFKGREVMYTDLGLEKFGQITERLADIAVVDEKSPPSGKMLYIVLAPAKTAQKQADKPATK